jgi:hypothetical protein
LTGAFRLWDTGTGDSVLSVIYHAATGLYRCYFGNDAFHRTVSLSTDTVYRLTYVYDSAQATADERIRLYIDGSRTGTVNSNPGQNDTIQTAMPTNIAIGLLNYPDLGGQYQGALFYAALYDGAATDSDVTAHDAALAANNDADPDAPAAAAVSPGGGGDHFRTRIR